jgi:hypothetical protein
MYKWMKTKIGRDDVKTLIMNLEGMSPYNNLILPHTEDDVMYDIIGVALNSVEVVDRLAVVTYQPFADEEIVLAYYNDEERVWYIKVST